MNFMTTRPRLAVEVGPILESQWTGIPVFTRRLIESLQRHGGIELEYVYEMCLLPPAMVNGALREGTGTFLRTFFEEQLPHERRFLDPAVPFLNPSVKTSFGLCEREASVVHDMSTLFMPENHEDANVAHHMDHLVEELDTNEVTFCVSAATEAALVGAYPSTRGRTAVLYQYADWPDDFEHMARNLKSLALGRYAVVVGTVEPRKNLTLLIEALSHPACADSDLRFIVIGRKGWKVDAFLAQLTEAQRKRLVFSGFVSEFAKYRLIRGSEFLVFPSLYEGFGIPALEAMSLGKPVLAARTSSFPEIIQDAGIYFDPLSVDDFIAALAEIEHPDRLRELAPHAIRHAGAFGSARMAAPVVEWLERGQVPAAHVAGDVSVGNS